MKKPLPKKQLDWMTNASFRSASYAPIVQNNPHQKNHPKLKICASVAFASKNFSSDRLKMSNCSKKILAVQIALLEFVIVSFETTNPAIIPTDNESVTRFFQTRAIPPPLWNAYNYVLHFNVKIADIASSVNTIADFFSKLDLTVTENIHLKIWEDLNSRPTEMSKLSSDVAVEDHVLFTTQTTRKSPEITLSKGKGNPLKTLQDGL